MVDKNDMRSAKEIVSLATIQDTPEGGSIIRLNVDVNPKEYAEFKKVVEHCGGLYKGKNIGHVFDTNASKTLPSIMSYIDRLDQGIKINKEEFFPTPSSVAEDLIIQAIPEESYIRYQLSEGIDKSEMRILEPSAGDGALIEIFLKEIPEFEGTIVALEIDPLRVETLRRKFGDDNRIQIIEGDFTSFDADTLGQFEVILMNPPFKLWEEHYKHAKSLLVESSDACLGAVLPNMSDKITTSPVVQEMYSRANTFCMDITEVEGGAFNKHNKKRGSLSKTGVKTIIMTESGTNHVPYLKTANLILETSCPEVHKIAYSEAQRLHDIASTGQIEARNVLSSVDAVEKFMEKNKKALIIDNHVPLPNKEAIRALAFTQLIYNAEDFGEAVVDAIRQEYKKILSPHTIQRVVRIGHVGGTPEEVLRAVPDSLINRLETTLYNPEKAPEGNHVTMTITLDALNEEDALNLIERQGNISVSNSKLAYVQDGVEVASWTPSLETEPKRKAPVTARQQELDF